MAADLSDHYANVILGGGTLPATQYLHLSGTLPSLDGTNITEPAQGDYVCPAIGFAAAAARVRASNALCDFISGGGNAAGSAGNFSYFAIKDSATPGAGNLVWRGTLTTPVAWVVGQPVEIAAGDVQTSFPNT